MKPLSCSVNYGPVLSYIKQLIINKPSHAAITCTAAEEEEKSHADWSASPLQDEAAERDWSAEGRLELTIRCVESRLRAGEGEEGEAARERRRIVGKIVTLLCLAGLKPGKNFYKKARRRSLL
jgi:hypothetical protein